MSNRAKCSLFTQKSSDKKYYVLYVGRVAYKYSSYDALMREYEWLACTYDEDMNVMVTMCDNGNEVVLIAEHSLKCPY